MDSRVTSKIVKKSLNSNSRKKKRHRKREAGRSENSPGGGKGQTTRALSSGQTSKDSGVDARENQRSLSTTVPGSKDSGVDTDSRDSGLEDCRPHSDRVGLRNGGGGGGGGGSMFTRARHNGLMAAMGSEVLNIKTKPDASRGDAKQKPSNTKDKISATKDKTSPVGSKQQPQQSVNQWATPSNNRPGKQPSQHVRTVPQSRSSLPNISARHEMTSHPGGGKAARASHSNSSVTSGTSGTSSLPLVVQICQESLRWEHELEDSEEEADRIRLYKLNRRKRYIAASNVKYEEWLSTSASSASLSGSSGTNLPSKGGKTDTEQRGHSDGHSIHANLVSGNKAVSNMYDEYSQLVLTHPKGNSGHRIMLNC